MLFRLCHVTERRGWLLGMDAFVMLMDAPTLRSEIVVLHLPYEASAPSTSKPAARVDSLEADMIGVVAVCTRSGMI